MFFAPDRPSNRLFHSPFSTHRAHKVVRSALGLGEDESLVFFLLHDLLHQLRQFPVFLVIRADVGDLTERTGTSNQCVTHLQQHISSSMYTETYL